MPDAAYALLGKIIIDGEMALTTPSGGKVGLSRAQNNDLNVDCERAECLWEMFDLLRDLNLVDINAGTLQRLRSPLIQTVHLRIEDRDVLEWSPGKYPKIRSARGLLDIFRSR